jgi:daunorubicin/doxorubicin transport system permease protein
VIPAFGLLVAIGFGIGWIFIVLGLLIRTPTTVMTLGFTLLFPLVFASNIMVEPATMPSWLRTFVDVNPVSLQPLPCSTAPMAKHPRLAPRTPKPLNGPST